MVEKGRQSFCVSSHFPPTPVGAGIGTCTPKAFGAGCRGVTGPVPSTTLHETVGINGCGYIDLSAEGCQNFIFDPVGLECALKVIPHIRPLWGNRGVLSIYAPLTPRVASTLGIRVRLTTFLRMAADDKKSSRVSSWRMTARSPAWPLRSCVTKAASVARPPSWGCPRKRCCAVWRSGRS